VNSTSHSEVEFAYPSRKIIETIDNEVDALSKSLRNKIRGWEGILPGISACVGAFATLQSSKGYQVIGWLRLAAAFRRKAIEKDDTACDTLAALYFLNKSRKCWDEGSKGLELNWVLDRALEQLGMNFEGGWIYNAITKDEMLAIQEKMLEAAEKDKRSVREVVEGISAQTETIRSLSILAEMTGFDQKLDALVVAAEEDGATSEIARAALVYLAEVDDVIPDDAGILGLLDDLYVIEWAYATIAEQAFGLPLLGSYQQRSPHLESSYLTVQRSMLDRFAQYVVGNAQAVLESRETDYITLRDAEAYLAPVIGSVVLTAMRENAEIGAKTEWKEGTILNLLNTGQKPERVRYLGRKTIEGEERIVVEVRAAGKLFLPIKLAANIEVSHRQDYKLLSNGPNVSAWQHNHSVDPLHYLLKGRPRSDARRAVLVIAPHNLLEHYLPSLHCRGEPLAKLVGATWINAAEREEPLLHSIIERSMIYGCGSAMVARNLIEDPPPGVIGFDLIALGTQAYTEINAEFTGQETLGLRMLCLADVSEVPRPPKGSLIMEDQEVLPWSLRPRGYKQSDPLARALARQYNHWIVNRRVKSFQNHPLATINKFLEARDDDTEEEFSPLVAQLRTFLSDAGRMPCAAGQMVAKLKERAKSLSRAANTEAMYDQTLLAVSRALNELVESGEFGPDIFLDPDLDVSKPVTILCRSNQEALDTTIMIKEIGLSGAGLTSPELFRVAPVEHLIVPGWHGAATMRRLDTTVPAAKLDFLLFDFQKLWFDRVTGAVRDYVRTFKSPTELSKDGHQAQDAIAQMAWPSPSRTISAETVDQDDFVPAIEKRPDLDRILKGVNDYSDYAEAKAVPVVLNGYHSYMFLPNNANLVLLNREVRRPEDACVSASQLREGDIFVLKDGSHRELFQELAPNYLSDPKATLEAADFWRQPLIESYEAGSVVWGRFRKRLVENGLQRSELAYRNWRNGNTLAPLNYREVIPIICSLSDDPNIQQAGEISVRAVAALYEARQIAAAHIFEQLLTGTADNIAGTVRIELGGTNVVLSIYQIEYVGELAFCARSSLWQLQKLDQKAAKINL
jgi:uncharacterized membrane protein YkvA (DUF1232 family)